MAKRGDKLEIKIKSEEKAEEVLIPDTCLEGNLYKRPSFNKPYHFSLRLVLHLLLQILAMLSGY